MSLRVRVFILFGALVAGLAGAQWLLVRSLTRDLSSELETVAAAVGQRVFRFAMPEGRPLVVPLPPHFMPGTPPEATPRTPGFKGKLQVFEQQQRWTTEPDGKRTLAYSFSTSEGGEKDAKQTGRVLIIQGPGPHDSARIPIPESGVKEKLARFQRQLVLGSLGVLGLGLLFAAVVADRVTAPLRKLAGAARQVGEGGLGTQVSGRAGGEVGEAIASFNAMSARLAELERRALATKESEHLGELGEVARGLAHALRNPLHSIGLSVEELAARAPEDAAELAESARRQIRQVDGSIRSFLALASGGAGVEEELDGRILVEDVALAALQDCRGRVRVAVQGEGARLRGVSAELRAVVQALVVNAIEASPDGETVVVRVSGNDGALRVEVEDAGPGLAPEVRERLFTPHVTTKPSGSGMGLFIAHRLAASRYAGSLALGDRPPHGTLAILQLADRVRANG